jgi:hypothetical protein
MLSRRPNVVKFILVVDHIYRKLVSKFREKRSYGLGVTAVQSWVKSYEKLKNGQNHSSTQFRQLSAEIGTTFRRDTAEMAFREHVKRSAHFRQLSAENCTLFRRTTAEMGIREGLEISVHDFGRQLPKCVHIFGS